MAELMQDDTLYDIPPNAAIVNGRVLAVRNGVTTDIGPKEDFALDYGVAGSAAAGPLTPGDRRRISAANMRELGAVGGAGALAELAQVGLSAIPTATDTRNAEKLAELQAREKSGTLGLTAEEAAQAQSTLVNPARALAAESRERANAQLASMGNTSLAAQSAVRAAAEKTAQDAALRAGQAITQANIEARVRNTRELEQRTQTEADKQAATVNRIGATIGQLATMGGKIAAAQVGKRDMTEAELKTLATATDKDGTLVNPDLAAAKTDAERRGILETQDQAEREAEKEQRRLQRERLRMRRLNQPTGATAMYQAPDDEMDLTGAWQS